MLSHSQKSLIQVSFRPTLSDQLIREEAAQRLGRAAATGAEIQVRNAKLARALGLLLPDISLDVFLSLNYLHIK